MQLTLPERAFQRCIHPHCGATLPAACTAFACPTCGGLMDVAYEWDRLPVPRSLKEFEAAWANRTHPLDFSGVWRFRRLFPFAPDRAILTIGEGQTLCQRCRPRRASTSGMKPGRNTYLQYEGMNPSAARSKTTA